VSKKIEDVASGGDGDGEHEAMKTSKGFARVPYEYSSYSKSNAHLPTINPSKPPQFDGVRYTDWAHRMKMHLIAARCWEIVEVSVRASEEDGELTTEDYLDIQQNATAASLILSCLNREDYNKVNGMESAKQI
jgi:hypothetical protein